MIDSERWGGDMAHTLDGFNRGKDCVIAHCSCGMSYYAPAELPSMPQTTTLGTAMYPEEGRRYLAAVEEAWEAATEATRKKWDRHQFIARGGVIYPDGRRVIGA